MIPLKDDNPRRTFPIVTILLIAVNTIVFLYEVSLPPRTGQQLVFQMGLIPARVPALLTGQAALTLGTVEQTLSPFFTSMFLHGGWLHLIGNMWFLWLFGDNVEDYFGHVGYLFFYLICGLGAGFTHTLMNLGSTIPSIGASGAISGVLGAYIVLFPRARVLTLVPLIIFFFTVWLPAAVILGYWFVLQFLAGLTSVGTQQQGGVAVWAHVGGFLLGVLIVLGVRKV